LAYAALAKHERRFARRERVQKTINIMRDYGGIVSTVSAIVDRSGGNRADFRCPFISLINMNLETFPANRIPPDLAPIPAVKPGSK
jgi:orotate phosphoribosyltransferase